MASRENRYGSQQLLGNTDVPFISIPALRGFVRRNDPDGSHAAPWFSGLSGTSLVLDVSPVGPITINFVSNDYQAAINALNAASPSDLLAEDADGFVKVNNRHAGGVNYIKCVSGAAAPILGFRTSPIPGSVSFSGELDTAPSGGKFQQNPEGTELISHDENLTSRSVNRAIVGSQLHTDMFLRELEREYVVHERLDLLSFYTHPIDGTVVFKITDQTLRIPLKAFGATTPQANDLPNLLDSIVQIMAPSAEAELFDSGPATGTYAHGLASAKLRVASIHYATDATALDNTTSFAAWGTPDGKSIFGDSTHWQKLKVPNTAIADIKGNIISAPGALFVTKNTQPGDTVVITGATNDVPFSHNGEFVVEVVYDESTLSVRAKSAFEDTVFSSPKPTKLNQNIVGGSGVNLGNVKVPVGFFLPATSVIFKLNRPWIIGSLSVRLAVGRYLRTEDPAGFARALAGSTDAFYSAFYSHITSTTQRHPATAIDYAGAAAAWADTLPFPADTVEGAFDTLVSVLAAKTGFTGAGKIGADAIPTSPRSVAQGSVATQLVAINGFIQDHLNQLLSPSANIHTADHINYAGGANTRGGLTNPASVAPLGVEAALDRIINNLNDTAQGAGWLNIQNIWTAIQFYLGTGDTFSALTIQDVPVARKPIFDAPISVVISGQTRKLRLYSALNGLEFTLNAKWLPGSTAWQKDISGTVAVKFRVDQTKVQVLTRTADANWPDTDANPVNTWEKDLFDLTYLTSVLNLGSVLAIDFSSADFGSAIAFKNTATAKHIPKAWALIHCDGPVSNTCTVVDGLGIAGVGFISDDVVRITLATHMLNTAYGVEACAQDITTRQKDTGGTQVGAFVPEPGNKFVDRFDVRILNSVNGVSARLTQGSVGDRNGLSLLVTVYGLQQ